MPLSDERLAEIRAKIAHNDGSHGGRIGNPIEEDLLAAYDESRREVERLQGIEQEAIALRIGIEKLTAEVERLHSWSGLMSLLDEHWPEDIFPTLPDDEGRDSGPRIVSLLRWVERLTRERDAYRKAKTENDDRFMGERDDARDEVERLRAKVAAVEALLLKWEELTDARCAECYDDLCAALDHKETDHDSE